MSSGTTSKERCQKEQREEKKISHLVFDFLKTVLKLKAKAGRGRDVHRIQKE